VTNATPEAQAENTPEIDEEADQEDEEIIRKKSTDESSDLLR